MFEKYPLESSESSSRIFFWPSRIFESSILNLLFDPPESLNLESWGPFLTLPNLRIFFLESSFCPTRIFFLESSRIFWDFYISRSLGPQNRIQERTTHCIHGNSIGVVHNHTIAQFLHCHWRRNCFEIIVVSRGHVGHTRQGNSIGGRPAECRQRNSVSGRPTDCREGKSQADGRRTVEKGNPRRTADAVEKGIPGGRPTHCRQGKTQVDGRRTV